jgi:hypothetical protein
MRRAIGAFALLCLSVLFFPSPLSALESADCIRKMTPNGMACVSPRAVTPQARFGAYTKAPKQKARAARAQVSPAPMFSFGGFGGGSVVATMQRYEGRNPTGWKYRWCAEMLNRALKEAGYSGTGSAAAWSFRNYGKAAPAGAVGSIGVMRSHVGVVTGRCANGRIEMVSGNSGGRKGARTVATGCYSPGRIAAYRWPV